MRLITADVANIASVRIQRLARLVGRTLPVVPVLTEAAVSVGSVATGDIADFGWLTAPAGVLLGRLFRARNVARARWPRRPEMRANPTA